MSLDYKGEKCPICQAYLFDEDDVVHCPVCGAPHHRDCYNTVGNCGLEHLHGTEKQYKKTESEPVNETRKQTYDTVKCRMCGEEYNKKYNTCPKCSAPNVQNMTGFAHFDFLGGIPADMDIGEGVTADEAKRFVNANTPRYIPKFAAMKAGKKASWNWLAFLFPSVWFLARKMYLYGIIVAVLSIAATMLQFPFLIAVENLGAIEIGLPALISSFGAVILDLIIRVVSAVMGDYLYRGYTISGVKYIRAESEDADKDYRKLGGISLWAMLLGMFAVQYIPSLLLNFLL